MKKEKEKEVIQQTSTFDVQIADTLFPTDPTKYEKDHQPIIEAKMKELGGNWKRLVRSYCSYYVSDLGKVINKDGTEHAYHIQNNGYISWRYTTIHRLVCYAFGKIKTLKYDPEHPEEIDHIDEDKTNNALSNLRVISHKDNIAKRDRYGFINCVQVDAYNYNTDELIGTYNSYYDASQDLNVASSAICRCVKLQVPQSKGFSFRKHGTPYVKIPLKERSPRLITKTIKKKNKVMTITTRTDHPRIEMWKDDKLYKVVSSFAEISHITGSDRHVIADRLHTNNLKPLRGFVFKYEKGQN